MKNLLLCAALTIFIKTTAFGFAGGNGSASNPWQIETKADIEAVNNDLSAHYILNSNIDMSGTSYPKSIIAGYPFKFTGSFDGNGFAVTNFAIYCTTEEYGGFFGRIYFAEIKNLTVENYFIYSGHHGGGLVGDNSYGSIINCSVDVFIAGWNFVGGLVAHNDDGKIIDCTSSGTISGDHVVGGLVGVNSGSITNCSSSSEVHGDTAGGLVGSNGGRITNCFATGTTSTSSGTIGGLAGANGQWGTIASCYSTGNVTTNGYYSFMIGGLVGFNVGSITDCYSTGSVDGSDGVGGLVGDNSYGSITNSYSTGSVNADCDRYVGGFCGHLLGENAVIENCFWDLNTSNMTTGYILNETIPGTAINVIGKTTAQMQSQNTFTDAGWDFATEQGNGTNDIWHIPYMSTGYPMFYYQKDITGDLSERYGVDISDYAVVADWWQQTDCGTKDNCNGADINLSGTVDLDDIAQLAENWLAGK